MSKSCIFCGRLPESKTKEHVIPRWLLALTGNPNRRANFGPNFDAPGKFNSFAFDSFQFPACRTCNERASRLEQRAAIVCRKLLGDGEVTGYDISELLDWLDKIRIGLWLAHKSLGGTALKVKPNFHINYRMRLHDRALLVFRSSADLPPLTFAGTFGPGFECSPIAFVLRIKHVALVNISSAGLCSEGLGFPWPSSRRYVEKLGGLIEWEYAPGRELFVPPFCPSLAARPIGGLLFAQPVFTALTREVGLRDVESAHVRRFSAGMPPGTGLIFRIQSDTNAMPVGPAESVVAVPRDISDNFTVLAKLGEFVLDLQSQSFKMDVSLDGLSEDEHERHRRHVELIEQSNVAIKDLGRRQLQDLGYILAVGSAKSGLQQTPLSPPLNRRR